MPPPSTQGVSEPSRRPQSCAPNLPQGRNLRPTRQVAAHPPGQMAQQQLQQQQQQQQQKEEEEEEEEQKEEQVEAERQEVQERVVVEARQQ